MSTSNQRTRRFAGSVFYWCCVDVVIFTYTYPPVVVIENTIVLQLGMHNLMFNLFVCLFICLFVCLSVFIPLENFSLICRRHHYQWRAANFDLCLAFMTIEQWGFFSVPHVLWHGASPRTRDTYTYCRAFGSWAVTTCFYDLGLSRLGTAPPLRWMFNLYLPCKIQNRGLNVSLKDLNHTFSKKNLNFLA